MSRKSSENDQSIVSPRSCPPPALETFVPLNPRPSVQRTKAFLVWLHMTHPLLSRLFHAILQEVCSYLGTDQFLVSIADSALLNVFEVQSHTWRTIRLQTPVYNTFASRFVQIDPERVLYCGGSTYPSLFHGQHTHNLRKAYLISSDGRVEALPDMHVARAWHGAVCIHNEVFVFLGIEYPPRYPNKLKSSELMKLGERRWEDLPEAQVPRRMFNPALWRGEVYLCGGPSSGVVEACSPETRSFRVVDVHLPESKCIFSYVHNSELVVVLEDCVLVLTHRANQVQVRRSERSTENRTVNSAVVAMGKVYALEEKKVVVFDARTVAVLDEHPTSESKAVDFP